MKNSELKFDGRVAIITGAGRGLGRIYAIELAHRGAKIIVNDIGCGTDGSGKSSKNFADDVVEELKANGCNAIANYDDVATVDGGYNIIKTAIDAFGKVDIVINNAGFLKGESFERMQPETWDNVINVHLRGAYCVTRPALKIMKRCAYGRIILSASAGGLYGIPGHANYCAAKAGLIGLMNALKLEGESFNIKINSIAPMASTRLTQGMIPEKELEKMKPEFIAPLTIYLASDKCRESGFIYNAGLGRFSRAQMVTGPAIKISEGTDIPSAEDLFARIEEINSLENFSIYPDGIGRITKEFIKA